ncbi:hypothetical protein [Mucilaginibacter aquaedulcis]|uniref:hypothetical protein n=1 Tax=Mucilaginibacter aquaedulcis TaxID=1187081 RepID=UPI0025B2E4D3|nr:hypothetical protein [Mucilaginibacter aquaedulcis]MDN3551584.1 hypothetical protein [Mucilaginibacter aquaedulcis]
MDELKTLEKYLKVFGKSVSAIVRRKIPQGRFPKTAAPRIDLQTYAVLKKVGFDFNQLIRKVNSGRNVMRWCFIK